MLILCILTYINLLHTQQLSIQQICHASNMCILKKAANKINVFVISSDGTGQRPSNHSREHMYQIMGYAIISIYIPTGPFVNMCFNGVAVNLAFHSSLRRFICDGCKECVLSHRFHSNTRNDFDLCIGCFRKEEATGSVLSMFSSTREGGGQGTFACILYQVRCSRD